MIWSYGAENYHIPVDAIKGRGATAAFAQRFSLDECDALDDGGWGTLADGVAGL